MRKSRLALIVALVAGGVATAQAQDVKVNALFIGWYTQMLDNNLRLNAAPTGGLSYYSLGGTKGGSSTNPLNENGFSVRRAEIYLAAKVTDEISANVMIDPNQAAPILFDAFITYKPTSSLEFRIGQFKSWIGYETTSVGSPDLLFVDRSMAQRSLVDFRERGVSGSFLFGNKDFGGKVTAGVFNGLRAGADRVNDNNAQKDVTLRVDFNLGAAHKFGAYLGQGQTDLTDKTGTAAATARQFAGLAPSAGFDEAVRDNNDKTTNYGLYYYFNQGPWHFDTEVMTGLLGRRFPSLINGTPAAPDTIAAKRQHLDQAFLGYYLTGGYTVGHHSFLVRYDFVNFNQGDKWYTTFNPYKESAPGVARTDGGDYTPKYTEITAGYTYAFKPESVRKANVKLNYIARSKNFLAPRAGQVGEQGGDSLVAAFQIYF